MFGHAGETARLTVVERTNITLNCPSAVSGSRDPTWTRENRGTNITVSSQNEMDKHARYSTTEETLTITDVQPDDAGLYYCDGKPVVHLNVTKDEQSEKGERQEHSRRYLIITVPADIHEYRHTL